MFGHRENTKYRIFFKNVLVPKNAENLKFRFSISYDLFRKQKSIYSDFKEVYVKLGITAKGKKIE
jgi:hypothetical protein